MKRSVWAALTVLVLFVGIAMPAAAQGSTSFTPNAAFGVVHEEDGDLWVTVVNLGAYNRTFEIRRWNPDGTPGDDDESERVWMGTVGPGWEDLITLDVTEEGHQALQLWYSGSMLGTLSTMPADDDQSLDQTVGTYLITGDPRIEVHHGALVFSFDDPSCEGTVRHNGGAYVWYSFWGTECSREDSED